ncbi:MAG TPA: hypothetical protein VHT31_07800 [Candidatus Acidoferrum sp.]|nr:hypothetical protein [Candidatus Acidoferrum sp.]
MNFRSSVAPQDSSRKLLTAFIFILIFVAGAYEFAQLVLSGDMMGFGYVALLVVGSVLGVQYVAKIFHGAPLGVGVESGFGALVVEMGIGGLIRGLS